MGGVFGGLLGVLEVIGWGIQYASRLGLSLLIGSNAWKWKLDTHPRDHAGFKEQRTTREALGGLTVYAVIAATLNAIGVFGEAFYKAIEPLPFFMIALLSLLPSGFLLSLVMMLRDHLESDSAKH